MPPKAFVTGANGMLADALCPLLAKSGMTVIGSDIVPAEGLLKLNVAERSAVQEAIRECRPAFVFHLAAETNVDKCESEKEHAFAINWRGTEYVAQAAAAAGATLVYISTGAVFDGRKKGGYTEEDTPAPLSVYGTSKLKGEEAVRSITPRHCIVRAGWMIGGLNKDKKFVWKILQQLKENKPLKAVVDKFGSPTFTADFSRGILSIVEKGAYGTYHCANEGICTRYDIARKIVEFLGRRDIVVEAVTSEAFPLPAPRGESEALLNAQMRRLGLPAQRHWEEALREYLKTATAPV